MMGLMPRKSKISQPSTGSATAASAAWSAGRASGRSMAGVYMDRRRIAARFSGPLGSPRQAADERSERAAGGGAEHHKPHPGVAASVVHRFAQHVVEGPAGRESDSRPDQEPGDDVVLSFPDHRIR